MMRVRKSGERGYVDRGWLQARHSFSFGSYQDPEHMGFGLLRVINQDRIAPEKGFGTHPHEDMEIISYITMGRIAHKDSMGNSLQISAGEVQVMSAGTGVAHSEFNPDSSQDLCLLQIWIETDKKGHSPRYGQKAFDSESKRNQLRLIVSGNGGEGSLEIHQDVKMYASILEEERSLNYSVGSQRKVWIQLVTGKLRVNNQDLVLGDGLAVEGEERLAISSQSQCEFLLIDLP